METSCTLRLRMLAGIVLCVSLVSGCLSTANEFVALPLPAEEEWKVGYTQGNEMERIVEFVRSEENVENWTELVTQQAFNKAVGLIPLAESLEVYRESLLAERPGSTVTVIRQEPNSVLYESHIRVDGAAADERSVARMLDGQKTRFLITYAVRGPVTMTPTRRAEWIERLTSASIQVVE